MTIFLNLGVIDQNYSEQAKPEKIPQAKKGKKNKPIKPKVANGTQTTGDVAGWIEEKYGLMENFAEAQGPAFAQAFASALSGELENMMTGGQPSSNPFKEAESEIETMFKTFLSEGEAEHLGIEGVPTQAAIDGVNHRLAHPYAKGNPRRPSFIDTGLLQSSFKAWIE